MQDNRVDESAGEGALRPTPDRSLRHLRAVLCAALLVEAAMYSVLTPLLPGLRMRLGLSTGQAGILFGSYVLAFVIGVLIGWWRVPRSGPRRTTWVALVAFAVSTVGFAFADSYWPAVVLRFVAGVAGGLAWVAILTWLMTSSRPDERGRVLGLAFSVAVVGTLLGPVLGNLASAVGMLPVFGAVALVAIIAAIVLPSSSGDARVEPIEARPERTGQRTRRDVAIAAAAMVAIALTYGALFVLLPLRLSSSGVDAQWIGWAFALSAGLAAVANRTAGSASDRVGTFRFSMISLIGGAVLLVALSLSTAVWLDSAAVIIGMGLILATGMAPSSSSVSLAAGHAGVGPVTVSVLVLAVFSGSEAVGSLVVPALAELLTTPVALSALAVVNVLAAIVLAYRRHLRMA